MRLGALALVALAGSAAADSSPPVAASGDSLAEVSFETTPGKPMQLPRPGEPAEKIVARRDARGATISVTRNVAAKYESHSARLSPEEWAAIERVVKEHKLLAWQASPTGDQRYFDYPSSGFQIARKGQPGIVQHWSQPVAEIEQPQALARELARLARARVPEVVLYYLVP